MTTERRLSVHTDKNYAVDLAALTAYCDKEKLADWKDLDTQHVRTFAARSHAAGLAPKSIQRRLSAVRSFFDFLIRETLAARSACARADASQAAPAPPGILSNPAADVRAPKARRTLPNTLDADQMARLVEDRKSVV